MSEKSQLEPNLANYQFPPSPELTIAEQTFRWMMQPLTFLDNCSQQLGDSFTINLKELGKHVLFSEPNVIREILKTDPKVMYGGGDKEFMRPILGDHSLFLQHQDAHLHRRRLLNPKFHPKKIAVHGEKIRQLTLDVINQWQQDEEISLIEPMLEISKNIIFDIVFGLSSDEESTKIKIAIAKLLQLVGSQAAFQDDLDADSPLGKVKQQFLDSKQEVDNYLYDMIAKRREQEPDNSIISILTNCEDENGEPLSDQEIRDQLITLLIAGHETTATSVSWSVYWILKDSAIEKKLVQELESYRASNDLEELVGNKYLHAVCQEALRIVPTIAMISRTLRKDLEIDQFNLPAGVHIAIPIYLLHQRNDLYPEPKRFVPQRFLDKKFLPNEYMPFGGGSRICLGMHFALYEMKIMLGVMFSNYQLQLADDYEAKPIRRSVIMSPSEGVRLHAKKL